ncbi:MAG: hypothetical protein LBG65_02470 [Puniceicoccales bacterium]|jgi:hypothetical protein|nr:hypothetical protein [Puniceicoccales bacterium]
MPQNRPSEAQRLLLEQKKRRKVILAVMGGIVFLALCVSVAVLVRGGMRIQPGEKVALQFATAKIEKMEKDFSGREYRVRKVSGRGGFLGQDYVYVVDDNTNSASTYRKYYEVVMKRYLWVAWMPQYFGELSVYNEAALAETARTRGWDIEN